MIKGKRMDLDKLKLIEPTETLREEFQDFVQESRVADEKESIDGAGWNFDGDLTAFVQKLRDYAQGINLPGNRVKSSAYWFVRCDRIIGVCDIRHRLNDELRDFGGHIGYSVRPSERSKGCGTEMLRLALEKARELGIDRALITCDVANIASQRVILKNGGVLDSESYSEEGGRVMQRYWIDLIGGGQ